MKSDRKKLREDIGKLHFAILKLERGEICEICGRTNKLGRFHILTVASQPRLEFNSWNVLIVCWMPCHFYYHHDRDDIRAKYVIYKIKKLRGKNYLDELKATARMQPRYTMTYLRTLKQALKLRLKQLTTGREYEDNYKQ